MTIKAPFQPSYTLGQVVAPAAAAASITIGAGSKQLCLTNLGSNICYVRVGTGTIAATTADMAVPPGVQITISKAQDDSVLSHISALGTSLHVIPGEGF